MEKKTKKELLQIIEDQNLNLTKYKSRLHDIVGSYKHLVKEKETLENSIKTLTEVINISDSEKQSTEAVAESHDSDKVATSNRNDVCLQQLKSSLGALTLEKSRVENELKADRKLILQQKEEIEQNLLEKENKWMLEKEKYKNFILELRKKISTQQREREKEQHDHVLMLKELQNVVAVDRVTKEKLEEQVAEMQLKYSNRVPDRKALEYEKTIEDLQNKLIVSQDRHRSTDHELKRTSAALMKLSDAMEEMKVQCLLEVERERERADLTERKSELLTLAKEQRVAALESRVSELSAVVGDHDKLRQHDLNTIQKLKARVVQLQAECSAFVQTSGRDAKFWSYSEGSDSMNQAVDDMKHARCTSDPGHSVTSEDHLNTESEKDLSDKSHAHCQAEIYRLKEELEQYKSKAESAIKEKYSKTSAALLTDARTGKEIKELKSRLTQLQDQLQSCKSQLKLNEEYHGRITSNLEKSSEDLRLQQRQDLAHLEQAHRARIMELEHQIQKQRERTLALLEEKDKEIELLKSSYLDAIVKKDPEPQSSPAVLETNCSAVLETDTTSSMLPNSLISSKKEGHILFYIQELSRKDVELSSLRQNRIKTESALRKLQQKLELLEQKYSEDLDALQSKIKLLESSRDERGTNVEYLKNVVLRFLKCNDPSSKRHMVNAISTVLHFTSSEIQDVKDYLQ